VDNRVRNKEFKENSRQFTATEKKTCVSINSRVSDYLLGNKMKIEKQKPPPCPKSF
jgi:hypothetical protein